MMLVLRLAPMLLLAAFAFGVEAAESVSFPANGIELKALLYRPAGAGPFPAVVALHGCGGLYNRNGVLNARHADWGERLAAQGFVVLFPDSFGSRGAGSQCATTNRVARPSAERVSDAFAANAYLLSRPDVKSDAVSLLGWSNGGSTVLYSVEAGAGPRDGKADFARAVAFYPGCRVPAERGNWRARLPVLILIGAADDWTPAAPCEALANQAAAAGMPVSITIYPGAYHDFDYPNLPLGSRSGLAFSANGSGTAHVGTDPAARDDALRRVPMFLAH
jgi:dienelactone hydrolase